MLSDPSKAKKNLGWEPKVKVPELVKMMVQNDLEIEVKSRRQIAAIHDRPSVSPRQCLCPRR
jgi:hypothetical protein